MGLKAVVVDDHPMCRAATAMAFGVVDPQIEVAEASSLAEAIDAARDASLITLDLGLPDNRGLSGLGALREAHPELPILVISGANNPAIARQVARMGASGFLGKAAPISEMVRAMRAVLAGERWFPPTSATPTPTTTTTNSRASPA